MRGLNHQVALDLDAPVDRVQGNFEPPAFGVVWPGNDQVKVHLHAFMVTSPSFCF